MQYETFIVSQKNTLRETEDHIKLLKEKKALAENELKYTKDNIDTSSNTDTNNLERDMANAKVLLEEINTLVPDYLKEIDDLLYIERESNYGYGDFSGKDPSIKANARDLYTSASGSYYNSFARDLQNLRKETQPSFDATLAVLQK